MGLGAHNQVYEAFRQRADPLRSLQAHGRRFLGTDVGLGEEIIRRKNRWLSELLSSEMK